MKTFDEVWSGFTPKINIKGIPFKEVCESFYENAQPPKCDTCEDFEKVAQKDYGYCTLLQKAFDKNGFCSLHSDL